MNEVCLFISFIYDEAEIRTSEMLPRSGMRMQPRRLWRWDAPLGAWKVRRHVFAYSPKTGCSVLAFLSSLVRSATEWTATQHVGWWGGVGCNDILELAHMVDATVNLLTWLMLRNMMGWGGWGMMLTFLELAYMVDATQHDGVALAFCASECKRCTRNCADSAQTDMLKKTKTLRTSPCWMRKQSVSHS